MAMKKKMSGKGMKMGKMKATGMKKPPKGKAYVAKGSANSLKAGRKALKGVKF